ncbi:MAG: hypothetical protein AB7T31_05815 [Gemmatimonadales bacterium]
MSTRALNPEPSPGAVAGAQLRMIAHLQKRDFIVLGALVVALIGLVTWAQIRMDADDVGSDTIPIFRGLAPLLALVGAFWPLGVWRADTPERRGYFWSLPVERRRHTLVRVASGWGVLLGVCLILMVVAVAALAPSAMRFEQVRLDLGGAWQPLATATLAYLLVSTLAVLFENPVRWLAFAWLGVLGVFIVGEAADLDGLSDWTEDRVASFFVALGGPVVTDRESVAEWSRHWFLWLALGSAALVGAVLWRHEK